MRSDKTVGKYISDAPKEVQEKLKELRSVIKKVAPKAEEKISYSMPFYNYLGPLAYFAYAKKHLGLYIPPPIIREFKNELEDYKTSKAAIQFPLDKKLPTTLIKKLVRARIAKNRKTNEDLLLLSGRYKSGQRTKIE